MNWQEAVGGTIENRRIHLGYSKRAAARLAGVSEITWRQLESGARQIAPGQHVEPSPGKLTKALVCGALQWSPDSIDRLLAGQEPVVVSQPVESGPPDMAARRLPHDRQEACTVSPTFIGVCLALVAAYKIWCRD